MHRIVIACLAALACAAPAEAACPNAIGSLRFTVLSSGPAGDRVVRLCDRRSDRSRVVARGVSALDVTPPRVALATARRGRTSIAVHDLRTGRRERRIDAGRGRVYQPEVLLTTRGEVAWLLSLARRRAEVRVARPGTDRVLIVARGAQSIGLEDDRTIRYRVPDGLRYADLRRPPRRDGCPVRGGFVPTLSTPDMLVTTKHYGNPRYGDTIVSVVRACLRATGQDPVVFRAEADDVRGDSGRVVAARDGWVVVSAVYATQPGSGVRVLEVLNVDGRGGRPAVLCGREVGSLPREGDPVVVSDSGVPAWIQDESVLAAGPDRCVTALDRGDVAAVSAGTRITWTNAGEPRSATP